MRVLGGWGTLVNAIVGTLTGIENRGTPTMGAGGAMIVLIPAHPVPVTENVPVALVGLLVELGRSCRWCGQFYV